MALSAKLKLSQSIESERNNLQQQLNKEKKRCEDLSYQLQESSLKTSQEGDKMR